MFDKFFSVLILVFLSLVTFVLLHSCANMAAPTGGPYDVDPPVVVKASPDFNALNVTPHRVEIEFNENIKIESPTEKVIITPPQKNMPVIRAIGRKAVVDLKDELVDNTTYVIDFTDAIVDNNESNPLENFVFSFSTGDQLDTLSVGGKVLNAEDLEPMPGYYVGIHSLRDDTVFERVPLERISKTNSKGEFVIRGMAAGEYRVFALNDLNRDYKYDNPQEQIAFLDTLVSPYTMGAVRQDTVFADSVTIDTIKTVEYIRFMPDDLVLLSFTTDFQRKFLQKTERPERNIVNVFFGAPTEMPSFGLLYPEVDDDSWYVAERNITNDTLKLWITDSLVYREDSISLRMSYIATDTLDHDYLKTDTINLRYRSPNRSSKRSRGDKKDKNEEDSVVIEFAKLQTNIQTTFELFNPIRLEFEKPVVEFDSSYVSLYLEKDSVFNPTPFKFEADSLNPRKYVIRPSWEPGGSYKMVIDSASVFDVYGLFNDGFEQAFKVKSLDEYGNLQVTISGLPEGKTAFVQLLDASDKPFRKSYVKDGVVRFQDLPPGEMYARLIIDDNGDGMWTTGNYQDNRQPEQVYYYPGKFVIRAFSNHLEDWNLEEKKLIEQKPLEITKNKPQEKKRNASEERERQRQEQQQQQRQNSPFSNMGTRGGAGGLSQMR
ncbi:MAG: Ig-like domain-containing protein [Fermentimonas sp.]|jgi:uncharacterized protein (DUF2141 family)